MRAWSWVTFFAGATITVALLATSVVIDKVTE